MKCLGKDSPSNVIKQSGAYLRDISMRLRKIRKKINVTALVLV